MNKLYNTQAEITNKIREFLKNNVPNLRKNTTKYHSRNYFWYDFF